MMSATLSFLRLTTKRSPPACPQRLTVTAAVRGRKYTSQQLVSWISYQLIPMTSSRFTAMLGVKDPRPCDDSGARDVSTTCPGHSNAERALR